MREVQPVHGSDVPGYQSGIPGISWEKDKSRWRLACHDQETGKIVCLKFGLTKYLAQGMSRDDARTAALEDAADAREKKIAEGLMKEADAKSHDAKMRMVETKRNCGQDRKKLFAGKALPKSGVTNITWHRGDCCWQVQPHLHGEKFNLCNVTPLDASSAEVERTCLEAIEHLQKWRRDHGKPELVLTKAANRDAKGRNI